jgi:hypothetical protein
MPKLPLINSLSASSAELCNPSTYPTFFGGFELICKNILDNLIHHNMAAKNKIKGKR